MKALVVQLLPHRQSLWRDVAIATLAIISAGLLVLELSAELSSAQSQLFFQIDVIVALIFLADFAYELLSAHDKKRYLKGNWYLLLASVPLSGSVFQALRSVQLLRLLRIVRLYARIKALSERTELVSRHSSRYIFVALFATIVIFAGAVGFYQVEAGINPGINSFFDAIWWASVTATSVGYGDIFPVTTEGRAVSMVLMFFGLAMLGTIIGIVSNYFLTTEQISRTDISSKK